MKFLDILFNRKDKEEVFTIPDYFEITTRDMQDYAFLTRSKSFASKKELEEDGGWIDKEIALYKQTEKYKILASKINDLDFVAFSVKNSPYNKGSIDLTLGIDNNAFLRYTFNPSEGLGVIKYLNRNNDFSVGEFIRVLAPLIMNVEKVVYRKGKTLEFTAQLSIIRGEHDNDNEEITFLSSIKERPANAMVEYLQGEEEKEYDISLIGDRDEKVVIQNLSLTNEELNSLYDFYNQIKTNGLNLLMLPNSILIRLAFIGIINNTLVIKGNDNEDVIFTTLNEDELTDGMKSILHKSSKIKTK